MNSFSWDPEKMLWGESMTDVLMSFTVPFLSFLIPHLCQQAIERRTETDMKEAKQIII